MKSINQNWKVIALACQLSGIMFISCEKEVIPLFAPGEQAFINLCNASEVQNSLRNLRQDNMVFINDSISNFPFNTIQPKFPNVNTELAELRQFPNNTTGGGSIVDPVETPGEYQYVYYMPLRAGNYRFIYTAADKVFLQDTALELIASKYNNLYLAEDPSADQAYKIVSVPEERKGTEGKVRIKLVHLGTDSEPLKSYRLYGNGDLRVEGLPQDLSFGQASPYIELDTAGSAATYHSVMLKFYSGNNSNQALLSAAIPAISGSSFIVVVQGFQKETIRRIRSGTSPEGLPLYTSVTVQPRLRINLRRTY